MTRLKRLTKASWTLNTSSLAMWCLIQRHWLILVLPPILFLVTAGVTRQIMRALKGRELQNWNAHLQAAQTAWQEGAHEKGLEQLAIAESKVPELMQAYLQLATICERFGQRPRALRHMEHAFGLRGKSHPESDTESGYCWLAQAYFDSGEVAESQRVVQEKILLRWPKSIEGNYWQAVHELTQDGHAAARRAAQRLEVVLERDADHVQARYQYGLCQTRLGELSQAEQQFRKVLEANPNHAAAYRELAEVLQKLGRSDEANEPMAKFRELDTLLTRKSDLEGKVKFRKETLAELLELAGIYLRLNEPRRARDALLIYTSKETTDPYGHELLAQCHEQLHNKEMAAASAKLAAALYEAQQLRTAKTNTQADSVAD